MRFELKTTFYYTKPQYQARPYEEGVETIVYCTYYSESDGGELAVHLFHLVNIEWVDSDIPPREIPYSSRLELFRALQRMGKLLGRGIRKLRP